MTIAMQVCGLVLGFCAGVAASAAGAACVDVRGDLTQGGLIWGKVSPQARVTLDGAALEVLPDGHFVAGFGRDAGSRSLLVLEQAGERCRQPLAIATREYRIQRVEGCPSVR